METIEAPATPPAETAEPSGNQTVGQLAQMLKRRPSPASSAASSPATPAKSQSAVSPAPASLEPTPEADEEPASPPLETPDAEAAPQPTPDPNAEVDLNADDYENEDEHQPPAIEKMQKRISAVVKQRNDERLLREHAERKATELQEQLRQLQGGPKTPPTARPSAQGVPEAFAQDQVIRQTAEELADVEAVLNWAEENPDGAEVPDGKGGNREFSPAEVRKIRADAMRKFSTLSARREARSAQLQEHYNAAREQALTQAKTMYPWLNDRNTEEYQAATAMLQRFPAMMQDPNYPIHIGDYLRGRAARLAEGKASAKPALTNGKPKPAVRPTPVVTGSSSVPSRQDPAQKAIIEAEAEFEKTGSMESYKKVLSLKRNTGRKAA